ncbi:uncharacterized protein LOC124887024 [Capsicum annuum]|uniref:uncharacterized protein LOC124887024 n=1 Tax=Capsicum annuum TaxID=4072 RepID=UPI001FB16046|nr:uncharacterized protein LOC124887024 [Capsicum annuum]
MEGGLLLDVVVSKSSTILKLLSSKDQPLLVRRDTFLVLNLSLDIIDSVRTLNFKGNGLASEGLYKDLHLKLHQKKIGVGEHFSLRLGQNVRH